MVRALTVALAVVAGAVMVSAQAQEPAPKTEKKETTLKGTLVCAACALNETKTCVNALQVKGDGKAVVTYYLTDKGNREAFHHEVCGGGKIEGVTVTGTVGEKDGKKTIAPTAVSVPKKQ
jgi:invasion protein IalB